MLETLADHDDELMEQLLEDIPPPRDKVFDDLAKELRDGLICPVLMGAATRTNGMLRLLKALRHETTGVAQTQSAWVVKPNGEAVGYVLKTLAHARMAARLRSCAFSAGKSATARRSIRRRREAGRVSGVFKIVGQNMEKRGPAHGRRHRRARQARSRQDRRHACPPANKRMRRSPRSKPVPPVLAIAISAKERKDDVKLGQALQQAGRGGSVDSSSCTIPRRTKWSSGGRARCTCASRPNGWPSASASRSCGARRPSAIARPSAKPSCSAAATRSNRAAMASSATWCSTSSRCRAEPASPSRTRSKAAWCPATTSHRSRKAWSTGSSTGRSVFRWSMSR